jgi:alpha-amylase
MTKRYRLFAFVLLGASLLLAGCLAPAAPAPTSTSTSTLAPSATPAPVTVTPVAATMTSVPTLAPAETRVAPVTGLPAGTDGKPWWNDAVFYEVFVRSFYDSNGDGIGDFNGLTAKLDYLNDGNPATTTDLGVTALWLMPIHPSPSYHGYDVTDYYDVNPQYGTLADFKRLLAEAHKRGIRVILDLVLNHTSLQHLWFVAAQDPQSPYRDWYLWSPTDPGWPGPWGEKVWYANGRSYYYAIFDKNMPDLNYTNPAVTAKLDDVARFWLAEVGVDGFRLDAAKHLIEAGQVQENTASTRRP